VKTSNTYINFISMLILASRPKKKKRGSLMTTTTLEVRTII
jgi:hypothetical protein